MPFKLYYNEGRIFCKASNGFVNITKLPLLVTADVCKGVKSGGRVLDSIGDATSFDAMLVVQKDTSGRCKRCLFHIGGHAYKSRDELLSSLKAGGVAEPATPGDTKKRPAGAFVSPVVLVLLFA